MKRILSLILIMFVMCTSLLVGCRDEQAEIFIKDGIIELYTSKELDLSMVLSDEYTISCEQADVLLVEGNSVFAKKLGKATVKVETEDVTYYQDIEVLDGGVRPEILAEDFGLMVGASYSFDPVTTYKLKEIEGITYSYVVNNTAIAEVSNGKIIAKSLGQTEVKIIAQYKGVAEYAVKTVKCSVNELSGIDVKGSYELFIRSEVDGHNFNTTENLSAEVYVDGEMVQNASFTWTVADPTIATIEDGVLTAQKVGTTTIKAEYNDGNGKVVKTKDLIVDVKIPVIKVVSAQLMDLEKQVQVFDSAKVFVDGSQQIGYAQINGKEYQLTNNELQTAGFKSGEYDCVFYNADKTYGYEMQLVIADFVVYEASQLIEMADRPDDYIALANDIDYGEFTDVRSHVQKRYQKPGVFISPQKTIPDEKEPIASKPSKTFNGTLNGMGNAIKNIQMYSTGLFPTLGNSTIKNLAMVGVTLEHYNSSCFAYVVVGKTVVDNVYLEVTSTLSEFQGGVFEQVYKGAQVTLKNSIVKLSLAANNTSEAAQKNIGIVSSRHAGSVLVENCYFFSETNQIAGSIVKASENVNHALLNKLTCLFKNDAEFLIEFNREDNIIDYSGFNHYWTLDYQTGKVPVFNSAK